MKLTTRKSTERVTRSKISSVPSKGLFELKSPHRNLRTRAIKIEMDSEEIPEEESQEDSVEPERKMSARSKSLSLVSSKTPLKQSLRKTRRLASLSVEDTIAETKSVAATDPDSNQFSEEENPVIHDLNEKAKISSANNVNDKSIADAPSVKEESVDSKASILRTSKRLSAVSSKDSGDDQPITRVTRRTRRTASLPVDSLEKMAPMKEESEQTKITKLGTKYAEEETAVKEIENSVEEMVTRNAAETEEIESLSGTENGRESCEKSKRQDTNSIEFTSVQHAATNNLTEISLTDMEKINKSPVLRKSLDIPKALPEIEEESEDKCKQKKSPKPKKKTLDMTKAALQETELVNKTVLEETEISFSTDNLLSRKMDEKSAKEYEELESDIADQSKLRNIRENEIIDFISSCRQSTENSASFKKAIAKETESDVTLTLEPTDKVCKVSESVPTEQSIDDEKDDIVLLLDDSNDDIKILEKKTLESPKQSKDSVEGTDSKLIPKTFKVPISDMPQSSPKEVISETSRKMEGFNVELFTKLTKEARELGKTPKSAKKVQEISKTEEPKPENTLKTAKGAEEISIETKSTELPKSPMRTVSVNSKGTQTPTPPKSRESLKVDETKLAETLKSNKEVGESSQETRQMKTPKSVKQTANVDTAKDAETQLKFKTPKKNVEISEKAGLELTKTPMSEREKESSELDNAKVTKMLNFVEKVFQESFEMDETQLEKTPKSMMENLETFVVEAKKSKKKSKSKDLEEESSTEGEAKDRKSPKSVKDSDESSCVGETKPKTKKSKRENIEEGSEIEAMKLVEIPNSVESSEVRKEKLSKTPKSTKKPAEEKSETLEAPKSAKKDGKANSAAETPKSRKRKADSLKMAEVSKSSESDSDEGSSVEDAKPKKTPKSAKNQKAENSDVGQLKPVKITKSDSSESFSSEDTQPKITPKSKENSLEISQEKIEPLKKPKSAKKGREASSAAETPKSKREADSLKMAEVSKSSESDSDEGSSAEDAKPKKTPKYTKVSLKASEVDVIKPLKTPKSAKNQKAENSDVAQLKLVKITKSDSSESFSSEDTQPKITPKSKEDSLEIFQEKTESLKKPKSAKKQSGDNSTKIQKSTKSDLSKSPGLEDARPKKTTKSMKNFLEISEVEEEKPPKMEKLVEELYAENSEVTSKKTSKSTNKFLKQYSQAEGIDHSKWFSVEDVDDAVIVVNMDQTNQGETKMQKKYVSPATSKVKSPTNVFSESSLNRRVKSIVSTMIEDLRTGSKQDVKHDKNLADSEISFLPISKELLDKKMKTMKRPDVMCKKNKAVKDDLSKTCDTKDDDKKAPQSSEVGDFIEISDEIDMEEPGAIVAATSQLMETKDIQKKNKKKKKIPEVIDLEISDEEIDVEEAAENVEKMQAMLTSLLRETENNQKKNKTKKKKRNNLEVIESETEDNQKKNKAKKKKKNPEVIESETENNQKKNKTKKKRNNPEVIESETENNQKKNKTKKKKRKNPEVIESDVEEAAVEVEEQKYVKTCPLKETNDNLKKNKANKKKKIPEVIDSPLKKQKQKKRKAKDSLVESSEKKKIKLETKTEVKNPGVIITSSLPSVVDSVDVQKLFLKKKIKLLSMRKANRKTELCIEDESQIGEAVSLLSCKYFGKSVCIDNYHTNPKSDSVVDDEGFRFCQVYVNRIPPHATQSDLTSLFPKAISCDFPTKSGGRNKGYCHLTFPDKATAREHIALNNKVNLAGYKLGIFASMKATPKGVYGDLLKEMLVDITDLDSVLIIEDLPLGLHELSLSNLFPSVLNINIKVGSLKKAPSCAIVLCKNAKQAETFLSKDISWNGQKLNVKRATKNLVNFVMNQNKLSEEFEERSDCILKVSDLPEKTKLKEIENLFPSSLLLKLYSKKRYALVCFSTAGKMIEVCKSQSGKLILRKQVLDLKPYKMNTMKKFTESTNPKKVLHVRGFSKKSTVEDLQTVFKGCRITLTETNKVPYAIVKCKTAEKAKKYMAKKNLVLNGKFLKLRYLFSILKQMKQEARLFAK